MNYKVGVIKRVAFLLMTMALAVAMVACEGAVGKPGEPGKPAGPALQPPYVALALPDLPALVQGMSDTVDLSTAFGDPDGETLTLSAKSTDPAIATAKVSGKTLTVTGVKVGTTSVVVTATDADDLKVSQSVQVTVTAAPPEPDPPVTIDDVKTKYPTLVITPTTAADVSMEIELPAEHTLESENQSVVTVARKMAAAPASSIRWAAATADTTANVWVVTAVAKGLTNVDVLDKSGASVHTIRVRVATNPPAPEPDPVAPTKAAIPDQKLYKDDGAATIDLSDHFTHEMDIMYEASSDPTGFVSTKVAEGILTLTPRVIGQTIVTVTATADGESVTDMFTVDVMADSKPKPPEPVAPTKVKPIEPQTIYQGDGLETINLSEHFSHENEISYVADTRGVAVDVTTTGSILTLNPVLPGADRVTVTATADGKSSNYAFMVTVKAGTKPLPPPSDPPMPEGMIGAKEVEVGAVLAAMDVSGYFSPTGLIYTAESSATSKATATIPTGSSSLTIAGVAIGTATVTVTATDSDGRMATQMISVTVTAASLFKVMIAGVGETYDVSVEDGQTLQSLDPTFVTATRKAGSAPVWTLKGVKKTPEDDPAEVRIWNAGQTLDNTISVTVKNTSPKIEDGHPTIVIAASTGAATLTHVSINKDGDVVPELVDAVATAEKRLYHWLKFNFSDYFDDADGAALSDVDEDGYKAESNDKYIKVMKVLEDGVVVDVMKDVGSSFPLKIYVVDKSDAMSEKVVLTAESPMPIADWYTVRQDQGDGNFGTAEVWQREGVSHTLTFADFENDSSGNPKSSGFRFVSVFENEELEGKVAQAGTLYGFKEPDAAKIRAALIDKKEGSYYTVDFTGPLAMVTLRIDSDSKVPTLVFKVTGKGRATVTISYNVVVCDANSKGECASPPNYAWDMDSKTLAMNIVTSS